MDTIEPLESRRHLSASSAAHHLHVPAPGHVVVVVMENRSFTEIVNNPALPFLNSVGKGGAVFNNSHGIAHPSEPNYLSLFSGSTQGTTDDSPHSQEFSSTNLYTELTAGGKSFASYSESLPAKGYTGDNVGPYVLRHNPVASFSNVPAASNLPFSAFPQTNAALKHLPAVSFVIPNLNNDMHDGTPPQGDTWLRANLSNYIKWARTHNSLLVITWDEDDGSTVNQVPTYFYGPMVRPGVYSEHITHLNLLRTIEDMFGTAHTQGSASVGPIRDTWV